MIISENGYEDLISDHPSVVVTQGKMRGTWNAASVFIFLSDFFLNFYNLFYFPCTCINRAVLAANMCTVQNASITALLCLFKYSYSNYIIN